MKRDSVFSKILRWVGIVLMGLTSLFTLMGGIGTVCAALFPENFAADSEAMAALIGWEWLYIIFMLVTTAIGVMMVRATVLLIKGTANAYRDTIISLVAAVVVGFIHIYASRTIRGGSMPVDMVTYTAVFTLIVFLIFRIPFIWQGVNFEKPAGAKNDNGPAAAAASGAWRINVLHHSVHGEFDPHLWRSQLRRRLPPFDDAHRHRAYPGRPAGGVGGVERAGRSRRL